MIGTHTSGTGARLLLATVTCAVAVLERVDEAPARMGAPATLAAMTRSAANVFRGHCMSAEVGTANVAGARIPVTTYTFHIGEHLKGHGADTVTFRQVGALDGGPRDLGRLVGLPLYAPGTEYVLFLLPQSGAGLTSPAGAAEGAFVVRGDRVRGVRGDPGAPAPRPGAARAAPQGAQPPGGVETMSYEALRRAVLDEAGR